MNRREFLATPLALAACAGLPARPGPGPSGWAGAEGALDIGGAFRTGPAVRTRARRKRSAGSEGERCDEEFAAIHGVGGMSTR